MVKVIVEVEVMMGVEVDVTLGVAVMMGVRIVIAVSRPSYMSIRELSASLLDLLLYWVQLDIERVAN